MISTEGAILAAFVTPALLTAGAAATALPILIHLLARRRFKRVRWAAMEFLLAAQRRNRRRLRFEEWILLLLRCLAVLLMGMLVARPFLTPNSLIAAFGGARQVERVFVLDDSFSMGYRSTESGKTSFDRAREGVERLIQTIRAESPDDTVTLLRMTAIDEPLESGAYLNDSQTSNLLMRLSALEPSREAIDAPSVIQGIAAALERNPELGGAAVYVLSDFQRHNWARGSGQAGGTDASGSVGSDGDDSTALNPRSTDRGGGDSSDLLAPLAKWAEDGKGLRLAKINVADRSAANTAIVDFDVRSGQFVAGSTTTLRVDIANHAESVVDDTDLRVSVGARQQSSERIGSLSAHQRAAIDVELEFLRPGLEEIRATLPDDALTVDNERYFAADIAGAVRVLMINGEPSADAYQDELTFLATALRPEGELFSGNEIVVIDEAQLQDQDLNDFHLVVLANVYRVADPVVASLEQYVRNGGGLIVFLGDQVDAGLYNAMLYRDGEGVLPAELGEIVAAPGAAHLMAVDRRHPAMRGLSQTGDPLGIGQVGFMQYFSCAPHVRAADAVSEGTPGATDGLDDADAALATSSFARVVASFDDDERHPAIVERTSGKGRVILLTTSADKEWHLWPDHPTFLPVVLELAQHVARRRDADARHVVGAPIEIRLDPSAYEPDVTVYPPAYPAEREVSITAAPAEDGRGLMASWADTPSPGFYRFLLRKREGAEVNRLFAVNVDSRESDLSSAEEPDLRHAFASVPFDYVDGLDQLEEGATEARAEVWRPLLLLVALLLMGEQFLGWRWGRR
jgi:uncharacterized membrane protein